MEIMSSLSHYIPLSWKQYPIIMKTVEKTVYDCLCVVPYHVNIPFKGNTANGILTGDLTNQN